MTREQFKPTLQHFQKAFDIIHHGLLLQDKKGEPLYVNQALCHIFGASESELTDGGLSKLFPPKSLSRFRKKILPESEKFGIVKDEIDAIHKEGNLFPLSISTVPVQGTKNGITGYVSLCQDLSQEMEFRKQRLHSEKLAAIGEMLAGVAHELNNPLTSVVGFSELLLRKRVSPDIKKHLRRISSEAIRTSKIVQNLLSVVRSHKPEKILVGVNGVLQNVLELKSRQLHLDNIRMVKRLADDETLPKIVGDYQQLIEVFLNIINNAHQAMSSDRGKGTLSIKTEARSGAVIIRIGDTGPGIPKEVQGKLFHPFFTTKPEGCGLGLNISQNIIREHGGNITLENHRSRGCTFVICLPVAADQISKPAFFPLPATTTSKPLDILVLDDEEIILDLQYHMLTQMGHKPRLFKSVSEAISDLAHRDTDLILSDIKLPRMNGEKFFDHLKKHHPSLTKRIVFITGDVLNDATHRFLKKNKLKVLYKPFVLKQLEEIIQTALGKKGIK
ncbi:response regulator [Nitrospira defluvii]|nr:response regulator [Nitrospira defluvii]